MSDNMRWKYGDANPVVAAVEADTVIEIGDLVWQDKDDAKPASHVGMSNTQPEVAQAGFARLFLGVAMQRSRSGDTAPIRVATTGIFEFDCPGSKFELGDLMGAWYDRGLKNQGVDQVSKDVPHFAIGRVAKREPAGVHSVLVDIRSTVMTGGVS